MGEPAWPPGTPSFPDSHCLTSSFLAETLSHMRPSAEGLSQGILREKGTQLQEGQRCPQGKAFLPPTPETVCSGHRAHGKSLGQ